MKLHKQYVQLGITNLLLLGLGVYATYIHRYDMLFCIFLMLLVSLAPHFLKGTYNIHIPVVFIYSTIVFIFLSVLLGQFGGLYDRWHWWDSFLHFIAALTFGFSGFILIYVYYVHNKLKIPQNLMLILAFFFCLGIGALWEILEYGIDIILGTRMQADSLDDTMIDLVVDAFGGLAAIVMCSLYLSRSRIPVVDAVVEAVTEEAVTENKAPVIGVANEELTH
jgi:hypothetical protein